MTHLMKEFCVEIENTPGAISNVCTALGQAGVNLVSIASECVGGQGFMRIITDNEKKAAELLDEKDMMYSENSVIVKAFDDRPNQLAAVINKIASAGINIDALYLLQSKNGKAQVAIVTDDVQRAVRELKP